MLVVKSIFVIITMISICESVTPVRKKQKPVAVGIKKPKEKPKELQEKTPQGSCEPFKDSRFANRFHERTNCNEYKDNYYTKYAEGEKCRLVCKAGYQTSDNTPVCKKPPDERTRKWYPLPICSPQDCGTDARPGFPVSSFISSKSGRIVVYYVKYDKEHMLPIYSATLHDKLNYNLDKETRKNGYWPHPCKRLAQFQLNKWNKETIPGDWDTGHLTPYYAMTGIVDPAAETTSLYVNLALQDKYTNKGPWKNVEKWVFDTLEESGTPALVITGLCQGGDGTANPQTPAPCFWKLVCYKRSGSPIVVGFLAKNTPTSTKSSKIHRKLQSLQFRTQKYVLDAANIEGNRQGMWKDVHEAFPKDSREMSKVPTARQCSDEWESNLQPLMDY